MDGPDDAHLTITQRICANLNRAGDRPILTLLDAAGRADAVTYHQLVARARSWRQWYQGQNLCRGDRVIVVLPHSLDLYCSYLGAVLGGYVPAMFAFPSAKLSTNAYFDTVGELLTGAEARMVVTYRQLGDDLRQLIEARRLAATLGMPEQVGEASAECAFDEVTEADAIAFVQYSSGTTGLKKAVGITHQALLWQVDRYAEAIELTDNDRIVSWLPLYHDMGLIACYWMALIKGAAVVAMSPFDWVRHPALLLDAITGHRGTLCWQPNFAYNHLARSVSDDQLKDVDLSSMRGFVNCSEPIMASSHDAFVDRFAGHGLRGDMLWSCYAMAENVFAVTTGQGGCVVDRVDERAWTDAGNAEPADGQAAQTRRIVSSGRAIEDTDIKIVNEQGEPVSQRVVGQIAIQSPCLMNGYLNDRQATDSAIIDGWYYTGDLGYLADEHLFVTGRQQDMIIVAGRNIYPQDVETIVSEVPGVIGGRCVALGVDDPRLGTQRLVILAETHSGDEGQRGKISRTISERVTERMQIAVDDVRLLAHQTLAKSTSGKIARRENLARYLKLDKDIDNAVSRIVERAVRSVHLAQGDEPTVQTDLLGGGALDSLGLAKLIVDLETHFDVHIPTAEQTHLDNFNDVNSIAALIERLRRGGQAPSPPSVAAIGDRISVRDRKCHDFLAGPKHFDMLILGSSRSQNLSSKIAKSYGYRAYNFAVFSARAEDWYCIHRFVLDHNRVPLRRLVLGIDVEAFTIGTGMDPRLVHSEHLKPYLDESDRTEADQYAPDGLPQKQQDRYRQVLAGFGNQTADQHRRAGYEPTTGDMVYLDDDDVSQNQNQRRPVVINDIHGFDLEYKMRLHSFAQLNPKRLDYFVRMIRACHERATAVSCFLTPLHPALHQYLTQQTVYAQRLGELVNGLAGNCSAMFQLHDFTTPVRFGGCDNDFVNAAHIGAANADLLLRRLLDGPAAQVATA